MNVPYSLQNSTLLTDRTWNEQLAEQHLADRPDVERTDYLFDKINRDNRKMYVEVPPVVQIVPAQTNHIEPATFIMATIAAVGSVATLVLTLIV